MIPGNTGDRFPEVAHAHEPTISKVKPEEKPKRRRRRRKREPGSVSAEVTIVRVDRRVWDAAIERAAHVRNIQVLNETEVIVWNHGPPWPQRPASENEG